MAKDEAWVVFQRELSRHATGWLAKQLEEETLLITAWKGGRVRPKFRDLPRISAVITEGDPTHLARIMGIVPDESDVTERIARLYVELMRLDEQVRRRREVLRTTPGESAAALVSAATKTGRWAVGVWPAFEGPAGCKIHVSDRIDFRRTDGGQVSQETLLADLGEHLDEVNAVRNAKPALPRYEAAVALGEQRDVEHWSTYRFLADRPPSRNAVRMNVSAVTVIASSVLAWSADTAAVLSCLLGFGLISTRSLAVAVRRGPRGDAEALKLRSRFHRDLLSNPPDEHVWHHFGHFEEVAELVPSPGSSSARRGLYLVRLRETGALLDRAAPNRSRRDLFAQEHARVRAAIDLLPSDLAIEVTVDEPTSEDGSPLDPSTRRNRKMSTAMLAAGAALSGLIAAGHLSSRALQSSIHQEGEGERSRIYAWLQDQGVAL